MKDPFEKIMALDSVRASYVFSRTGRFIAGRERAFQVNNSNLVLLGGLCRNLAVSNQDISELILYYTQGLLFFRILGDQILVLVAHSRAIISLLRVTVEVVEHEWRKRGLKRLFPEKKGGVSAAGPISRFFTKRRGPSRS